ncbi:MAG: polysaccharide export protein, partial [Dysgonamonadaceae bacterium]
MRKTVYIFLMAMAAIALTGCVSTKEIAYLQGAETLTAEELAQQTVPRYDARILPKDLLTITVSATDPESVQPFNLVVPSRT